MSRRRLISLNVNLGMRVLRLEKEITRLETENEKLKALMVGKERRDDAI